MKAPRLVRLSIVVMAVLVGLLGARFTSTPPAGPVEAAGAFIDFETPSLGDDARAVINPYSDSGVTFTAEGGVVGLVKNNATSACVEPADANQKLGTAPVGSASIGLGSFAIRATFDAILQPPVNVSAEFQTGADVPIRIRLFDAANNEVGSARGVANPPDGTCGLPGGPRARTSLTAASEEPVKYAILDVDTATGGRVFVIDNFNFGSRDLEVILECPGPGTGGDRADLRGIRFTVARDFSAIELGMDGREPGTYSFDAELRRSTGFLGPADFVATGVTATLPGNEGTTPYPTVFIDFGDVTVSGAETFTLRFVNLTGPIPPGQTRPADLFFETHGIGNEPCDNVEETDENDVAEPTVRGDPAGFSVLGEVSKLPKLVYVFDSDIETAQAFAQFLEQENLFHLVAVPRSDLPRANLADAELIMVGHDIKFGSWSGAELEAILGSGKAVMGMAEGGASLYSELGLALGNRENLRISESIGSRIIDSLSPFLFYCDSLIQVNPGLAVSMYSRHVKQVGIDLSQVPQEVQVVGEDPETQGVATLATERNRFMLYGYGGSPADMTDEGKGMLRSALTYGVELGQKLQLQAEHVELVNRAKAVIVPGFLRNDLTITGLEITQAIQCYPTLLGSTVAGCEGGDNSLPVLTNRSTAVRVHLKLIPGIAFIATEIPNVPVRLYVKAGTGAGARIFTMDGAGTASTNPQRNFQDPVTNATHSANFFLSIDGDGNIPTRMCARVDPDNIYNESNESNNRFPASGAVEKTFEERRPIEIDALPIDYRQNNTQGASVPNNSTVTTNAVQWLNKVWPVPDKPAGIDYAVLSAMRWDATNANQGSLNTAGSAGAHPLIQNMNGQWVLASIFTLLFTGDVVNDHFYGWTPNARSSGGHADMPIYPHAGGLGIVAWGDDSQSTGGFNPDRGTGIFGHELTHDHDVMHTNTGADDCGSDDSNSDFPYATSSIQEVGFDPIAGTVKDPANTHDLMSYCPSGGTTNGWISPFTWNKMWGEYAAGAAARAARQSYARQVAPSDAVPSNGLPGDILVINALVRKDGTGEIGSNYIVEGFDLGLPVMPGDYSLNLLDGSGRLLATHPFGVNFDEGSIPEKPTFDEAGVLLSVPFSDKVQVIELRLGERLLDSERVSQSFFDITFDQIDDGRPLEKTTLVSWRDRSDADERTYALFYQREEGGEVMPLALDLKETQFLLDPARLPSTESGKLVLVASAGLQSTQVESNPFGVVDKPPEVNISEPLDGAAFSERDAVGLSGRGLDADDGILPGDSLEWSSDKDGELGMGNTLLLPPGSLRPGKHVITLVGTDSHGRTASASIAIVIRAAPTVKLMAEPSSGPAPLEVMFTAEAHDPDGKIVKYRWDFDSDGATDRTTDTRTTMFTYDAPGNLLASVEAVDDSGLSAFASVDIVVEPRALVIEPVAPPAVQSGGEFDVLIRARRAEDLKGVEFVLRYNPALLKLLDHSPAPVLGEHGCFTEVNPGPPTGAIAFAIACNKPLSGAPVPLWHLRFMAAEVTEVVDTALVVTDVVAGNSAVPPQEIPAVGGSDVVRILAGLCGDQNGDGKVNILDGIVNLQIIVGLIEPTELQQVLGDLNRNGRIDIGDVVLQLQAIVGLFKINTCGMPTPPIIAEFASSVRLIGPGKLVDGPPRELLPADELTPEERDPKEPPADQSRYRQMVLHAFDTSTQLEYEVVMDQDVLDAIHRSRVARGLTSATEGVDDPGKVEGVGTSPPPGVPAGAGGPVTSGWSGGVDSRVIFSPTTTWPWRTISQFSYGGDGSGCTGTLIGPRHLITAAHCIVEKGTNNWYTVTVTPARNGINTKPYGTSTIMPNPAPGTTAWYFAPAGWRQSSEPSGGYRQWDWGLIVIPNRLGDQTGWMGYVARPGSALEDVNQYNRGYPSCNPDFSERPAGCQTAKMYGDTNTCPIGGYSKKGPDGWNRLINIGCDISRGHSGSAVYHYFFDAALGKTVPVVAMMVVSHTCFTCPDGDAFPNWARRITPGDLSTISWLRQTFP
jgi:V8-like Glu-specific endopeptidase